MTIYFYNVIGKNYGIVLETQQYTTMLVTVVMLTGVMSLVKISQPFNAYRAVLCILTAVLVVVVLSVFVDAFGKVNFKPFGDIISVFDLSFSNITFLTTVVLSNYFILSLVYFLLSKIKIGDYQYDAERN